MPSRPITDGPSFSPSEPPSIIDGSIVPSHNGAPSSGGLLLTRSPACVRRSYDVHSCVCTGVVGPPYVRSSIHVLPIPPTHGSSTQTQPNTFPSEARLLQRILGLLYTAAVAAAALTGQGRRAGPVLPRVHWQPSSELCHRHACMMSPIIGPYSQNSTVYDSMAMMDGCARLQWAGKAARQVAEDRTTHAPWEAGTWLAGSAGRRVSRHGQRNLPGLRVRVLHTANQVLQACAVLASPVGRLVWKWAGKQAGEREKVVGGKRLKAAASRPSHSPFCFPLVFLSFPSSILLVVLSRQ